MHRRTLLAGWSTVLAGVLAGCGGGGDGETDGGATPADTETPTPTDTPTETATPAETPTPTDTPTPGTESFTHEFGEEFTVGGADTAITYRILELARSDRVGSQANYTSADGTFLIVTLEYANPQDETIEFPRRNFRLQDESGSWQRFDREPTEKLVSDGRLDVENIGDSTLAPGESKLGAVVFDVDPDVTYRIWITPAGEADTPEHFLPIGDISSIEELGRY